MQTLLIYLGAAFSVIATVLLVLNLKKKIRARWFWLATLLGNTFSWSAVGWMKWEEYKSEQEMAEMSANLKYWTEQLECDKLFGLFTMNNKACRDRVADQHGRRAEWEAEKKFVQESTDEMVKQAVAPK